MSDEARTAPNAAGDDLRGAALRARENLHRLRAGNPSAEDRTAAEQDYVRLAREYAAQRIREGRGPDPEVVRPEIFEETAFSMAKPEPFLPKDRTVSPSCVTPATLAALLSSGRPLAAILKAVKKPGDPQDAFNQDAPIRQLLRQWAAEARDDPFVSQCLNDSAGQQAAFQRAVAQATSALNNLRMKYELENREPENLTVQLGPDGRVEVGGSTRWEILAGAFSPDADEVYAQIAAAELAAARIARNAADLNRELASFFGELIPRYFALIGSLPRRRRNELTGGMRLSRSLAHKLIEAAESTDFAADPSGGIGFERPSLPRRLKLLAEQPGYKRVRQNVVGRKIQDASTVVIPRSQPTPEPDRRP